MHLKQICLTSPSLEKYVSLMPADQNGDFLSALDMLATAEPRGKLATMESEKK